MPGPASGPHGPEGFRGGRPRPGPAHRRFSLDCATLGLHPQPPRYRRGQREATGPGGPYPPPSGLDSSRLPYVTQAPHGTAAKDIVSRLVGPGGVLASAARALVPLTGAALRVRLGARLARLAGARSGGGGDDRALGAAPSGPGPGPGPSAPGRLRAYALGPAPGQGPPPPLPGRASPRRRPGRWRGTCPSWAAGGWSGAGPGRAGEGAPGLVAGAFVRELRDRGLWWGWRGEAGRPRREPEGRAAPGRPRCRGSGREGKGKASEGSGSRAPKKRFFFCTRAGVP